VIKPSFAAIGAIVKNINFFSGIFFRGGLSGMPRETHCLREKEFLAAVAQAFQPVSAKRR
jgi:hypothetical protein